MLHWDVPWQSLHAFGRLRLTRPLLLERWPEVVIQVLLPRLLAVQHAYPHRPMTLSIILLRIPAETTLRIPFHRRLRLTLRGRLHMMPRVHGPVQSLGLRATVAPSRCSLLRKEHGHLPFILLLEDLVLARRWLGSVAGVLAHWNVALRHQNVEGAEAVLALLRLVTL